MLLSFLSLAEERGGSLVRSYIPARPEPTLAGHSLGTLGTLNKHTSTYPNSTVHVEEHGSLGRSLFCPEGVVEISGASPAKPHAAWHSCMAFPSSWHGSDMASLCA